MNEMKINLHMFGVLMLDGVGRHVNYADVVAVNQSCSTDWGVQPKKLAQPEELSHSIGNSPILSLGAGA